MKKRIDQNEIPSKKSDKSGCRVRTDVEIAADPIAPHHEKSGPAATAIARRERRKFEVREYVDTNP
jgi:hypothetical protein